MRTSTTLMLLLWVGGMQGQRRSLPSPTVSGLTVESLLHRLEANLLDYRRSVPNLYCDEQAESQVLLRNNSIKISTDSTFRLRRNSESGVFDESRVVLRINGKTPEGDVEKLAGPAVLYGVFSDGLDIFSSADRACYRFKLHDRPERRQIVIDFFNLPKSERGAMCPPFEKTSGRAYVDPASFHVVRIEKRTLDHQLVPGIVGLWRWSVQYAPVTLLGRVFWMPLEIDSHATAENALSQWAFRASYTHYHLFHTESKIVPVNP